MNSRLPGCRGAARVAVSLRGHHGSVPPATPAWRFRMLFGQEHVRRYRETDGDVGYIWRGVPTLILTTTGRRSGQQRSTPLIFGQDGDHQVVVASKGGAPQHPDWYRNL